MSEHRWLNKFELKPGCWVFVPNNESRRSGKLIKRKLEKSWKAPYYYAHLRKGGHVSALKKHLGNDLFFCADIDQFFNSINLSRVTRELKTVFKNYSDSRFMACESVVELPDSSERKFILPFGFIQSAIIASLCLNNSALGKYLNKLESNGFRVSVYMDDIIISTSLPLVQAKAAFIKLQDKAVRSGFHLNTNKTFGPRETITAFNIHLSKGKIELTDDRLEEFKKSIVNTDNSAVIDGILGYANIVCSKQASILEKVLELK